MSVMQYILLLVLYDIAVVCWMDVIHFTILSLSIGLIRLKVGLETILTVQKCKGQ